MNDQIEKLKFLIKNIRNVKTLFDFNAYLDKLSQDFGEAVTPSPAEMDAYLSEVRNRKFAHNQFFMVARTVDTTIPFHLNTEKFLNIKGKLDANKFLYLTHPQYLGDYLQWGLAAYSCVQENKHLLEPLKGFFRLAYPIRLRDEKYHWVTYEAIPLSFDKDGNMISHFNTYTVLNIPFDGKQTKRLIGDFVMENFPDDYFVARLKSMRFSIQPFTPTISQKQILGIKKKHPDYTNAQMAKLLSKDEETIKTQNKQLLAKARQCFPHHFPEREKRSINDLVLYLGKNEYQFS